VVSMSGNILTKITAVLLPAFTLVVMAQTDKKEFSVQQLMEMFAVIKSYESDFIEQKSSTFLTKKLELKGRISYEAPDKLEKITTSPFQERLYIDGDTITIEKPGEEYAQEQIEKTVSLDSHPAIRAIVDSVRSTLAGDLKSLQALSQVRLTGDRNAWQLTLVPRNKKLLKRLAKISIHGSHDKIIRVDTEEADGDQSVLTMVGTSKP